MKCAGSTASTRHESERPDGDEETKDDERGGHDSAPTGVAVRPTR